VFVPGGARPRVIAERRVGGEEGHGVRQRRAVRHHVLKEQARSIENASTRLKKR